MGDLSRTTITIKYMEKYAISHAQGHFIQTKSVLYNETSIFSHFIRAVALYTHGPIGIK